MVLKLASAVCAVRVRAAILASLLDTDPTGALVVIYTPGAPVIGTARVDPRAVTIDSARHAGLIFTDPIGAILVVEALKAASDVWLTDALGAVFVLPTIDAALPWDITEPTGTVCVRATANTRPGLGGADALWAIFGGPALHTLPIGSITDLTT